jgi:integrase
MAPFMVALKRRKVGGYAARKVIPKDVRQEYAVLYGMGWEEKLNIPANTPLHEAKARHGEWLAEIETRIAALRAAKTGKGQPLTRRNAHALAGEWYRWFLAHHEGDLRTPSHWRRLSDTLVWDVIHPHAPNEHLSDTRADPEWEWKSQPEVRAAVRPLVALEAKVASFLLEKGISLNEDATGLLLDAVEDNLLMAFARLEALARGDYGPDPVLENFPSFVPHAEHATIGCWTLFERWQSEVKPSRSTIARWTSVIKAADARFPVANMITPELAKAWMIGLIDNDRSAQTVATVWKTALKTVFTWALGEKLIESNPFKELKISVPRKTIERETKAFTSEEAETILAAALAYRTTTTVDERARRWVPWLCAYTGARAGEITQLRGSDIFQRGADYFAKLSPSAGKMKTRTARTVPLHEHLIEQGFMSFVETSGSGPLFYAATTARPAGVSEPIQNRAERTRERLGNWVRSLGITDPELSPNHAWRHTFKARAERYGISERYSDAITGHAPPTAGRAYGKPTPDDLAHAMRAFPRYSLRD